MRNLVMGFGSTSGILSILGDEVRTAAGIAGGREERERAALRSLYKDLARIQTYTAPDRTARGTTASAAAQPSTQALEAPAPIGVVTR